MKLFETPPKHPPVELTFNVIDLHTGKQLNAEPLSEDAARTLAHRLHENDSKVEPIIRSNRATLMG